MQLSEVEIGKVLTRTTGFLETVSSHSLQPYCGCSLGRSLCGVGCYVRHNRHLTRGREWGTFLEVRTNAAASYLRHQVTERQWAESHRGEFAIFMSSSTDPFLPQERIYRVTGSVLEAMVEAPPDSLILQTHTHRVVDALDLIARVAACCRLRVHISIESDRDRLPGLPPPASSVTRRLEAARQLRNAGIRTVVTVSPLLPIRDPEGFFERIAECADAVVLDHYIEGDGSPDGRRTRRTRLPAAIDAVLPEGNRIEYRDRMAEVARRFLPGRVGVHIDGFAGTYS